MPTYQSGAVVNRRSSFHQHPDGTVGVREATFTFPANPLEDDIVEMIPINANERVVGLQFYVEEVVVDRRRRHGRPGSGTATTGTGTCLSRPTPSSKPAGPRSSGPRRRKPPRWL